MTEAAAARTQENFHDFELRRPGPLGYADLKAHLDKGVENGVIKRGWSGRGFQDPAETIYRVRFLNEVDAMTALLGW